ncbi:MAG: ComEC/Rec2 family competence protein [Candidatus Pseudoruminococcus sp.]|uniref:ComEC/Rec2 family competence protein n=1 Tax=Candidatus Pseudoruminococcus sp. TaxID=3101048 RepID=UPI002A7DF0E0|nr:MBL fold metallo-hydrolase [Ruminococcus sp.]MDY2782242.1 ComEC/Rec2 family competence protein [Candidatus Pseudoruminococcus sp.]
MSSSNKNYNRRAGTPSLIVGLSLAVIAAVIALIVSSQTNRNQEQKPVAQTSSQDSSVVSTVSKVESSEDSEKKVEAVKRNGLEIKYIDVGQGNSTLVMLPDGKNLLIDAGSKENGDKLVSYLKNEKIEKIDYLIATNADVNDIGGMPSVIENFDIGRVYAPNIEDIIDAYETEKNVSEVYKSFTEALSAKKLVKLDASSGTHVYFSLSLTVDIISPNDSAYSDLNNYSTAVLLKYGQQKFIFMSDAENYSEQEIIDNGIDITSDVIMIGNHGSSAASGKSFIKAVAPKYAVISCGANNSEGYPHQETLKTLEQNETKVFRTDLNGTITLKSDGMNELKLTPEKQVNKETASSIESSATDESVTKSSTESESSDSKTESNTENETSKETTEESIASAA